MLNTNPKPKISKIPPVKSPSAQNGKPKVLVKVSARKLAATSLITMLLPYTPGTPVLMSIPARPIPIV